MTPTSGRGGAQAADHPAGRHATRRPGPARARPPPTIASAGAAVIELGGRRQTDGVATMPEVAWGGDGRARHSREPATMLSTRVLACWRRSGRGWGRSTALYSS
jgi:hypothetical protein